MQENRMITQELSPLRWTIGAFSLLILSTLASPGILCGQDEDELPEPRDVRLETSDGVALFAVYYPGTREKETVPVILLHAWESDHKSLVGMASSLQKQYGYAVIVPDLRGHGQSNKSIGGKELDPDLWRGSQLALVIEDIEACKNFLIGENNQGNVNIDLLAVVAEGESTILAALWTVRDWSYPPLGSIKQGQDVKTLVLLNPVRNFRGLDGNNAFQNNLFTGRSGGVFPVIVASERSGQREAQNIHDRMMRGRKSLDVTDMALERHRYEMERQVRVRKSRRDGNVPMDVLIGDFVKKHVYNRRQDFRWAERGSK
jgi:pimeloyl-ACP methyl ester carboxylesterase